MLAHTQTRTFAHSHTRTRAHIQVTRITWWRCRSRNPGFKMYPGSPWPHPLNYVTPRTHKTISLITIWCQWLVMEKVIMVYPRKYPGVRLIKTHTKLKLLNWDYHIVCLSNNCWVLLIDFYIMRDIIINILLEIIQGKNRQIICITCKVKTCIISITPIVYL